MFVTQLLNLLQILLGKLDPDHRCNKVDGGYWVAASINQIQQVKKYF